MISRRNLVFHAPLAALARASAQAISVGCQTNAWKLNAGDFPELLKRVAVLKRLGYGGFECNIRFVQSQFANAKEVRAQIQDTGVRFYGPHVGLAAAIRKTGWTGCLTLEEESLKSHDSVYVELVLKSGCGIIRKTFEA